MACALLLLLLPSVPFAQPAIQAIGNSATLDWTGGTIKATGFGFVRKQDGKSEGWHKIHSSKAAMADAHRNMAEAVNGLRVSAETTVQDMMAVNDRVTASVRAFISGARVVSMTYEDNGDEYTCEVELEAPLGGRGGLSSHILYYAPPVIQKKLPPRPAIQTVGGPSLDWDELRKQSYQLGWMHANENPLNTPNIRPTPAPPGTEPTPDPTPAPTATPTPVPTPRAGGDGVTGILFDARGQNYSWNLFPIVQTESASGVFDVTVLQRAPDTGFFSPFAFSPEQGREHERTMTNPLTIEARSVKDGTLVISDEDGRRILQLNGSTQLLENGRVLFIIKPPAGEGVGR